MCDVQLVESIFVNPYGIYDNNFPLMVAPKFLQQNRFLLETNHPDGKFHRSPSGNGFTNPQTGPAYTRSGKPMLRKKAVSDQQLQEESQIDNRLEAIPKPPWQMVRAKSPSLAMSFGSEKWEESDFSFNNPELGINETQLTTESSGLLPSGSQDSGSPVFSLSTNTNENLADCVVRKGNLDVFPRTQRSFDVLCKKILLGPRVIVEDVTNDATIVPHVINIMSNDNNSYTREGESTSVCSMSRMEIIKNTDLKDLRELGSGTFGTVYNGKWRGTDVAIKRIKNSCFSGTSSEQDRQTKDFWREARILANLHHPNVVAFLWGCTKRTW
ncbi:unnamed protein product [Brassica oleracea]|uniref:Protein kinase domain-containing protein n=1 Tax=Brassica oleracea TaxID=3712 RepID=A0A3P6BL11_BRAOL|nr:unnamed protein product [Brassica oleracea]